MKKLTHLLPLLLLVFITGCGTLIPKKVEFFQDKVKAVPVVTEAAKEHQRQAAQFEAKKVEEAKLAAVAIGAPDEVTKPLTDASTVADALTDVLGPADDPWWLSTTAPEKVAPKYAAELKHDQAKLNERVADYAKDVQKDVGKKIEGTGLVQVGYFTYIGIIIGLVLLAYFALKIYGSINPAVGLGVNTAGSIASSVLSKGFSELVAGGEQFKDYVENSPLTAEVKNYVIDLFTRAHTSNQSADVQTVVDKLTASSQPGVAPPIPPVPVNSAPTAPLNVAPTPPAASALPLLTAVPVTAPSPGS